MCLKHIHKWCTSALVNIVPSVHTRSVIHIEVKLEKRHLDMNPIHGKWSKWRYTSWHTVWVCIRILICLNNIMLCFSLSDPWITDTTHFLYGAGYMNNKLCRTEINAEQSHLLQCCPHNLNLNHLLNCCPKHPYPNAMSLNG